ncbi:hypothetical protein BBJ29_006268 [Phytophthora kernoviae]|uniref:Uncharacterized protein n=1 Tax=Phytophthora kernoviae TaxID=325452 RepID=A0A3F2RFA3_9STRA|nr:hypothetical protein BBJ29_006268 [Phytophthora kernoviae]RLN55456.1 hypothetical protein BBP00_00008476 [Phytophthora kernoviae]
MLAELRGTYLLTYLGPLRLIVLVAAVTWCSRMQQSLASPASSCSSDEFQQVQTRIAGIRATLDSASASGSKLTKVPTSCKAALTFDLLATNEDDEHCATDCLVWIEDMVDAPTCGEEEMLVYQRRMATYMVQCNDNTQVGLQRLDNIGQSLRGLTAGRQSADVRSLGIKGLMDALLVLMLNNAS